MKLKKESKRRHFCGECLQELQLLHWLKPQLHIDGTLLCKGRVNVASGPEIRFEVDSEMNALIEASGLDPRNNEYWERHPASDGNKGWRSWRGKKWELGD